MLLTKNPDIQHEHLLAKIATTKFWNQIVLDLVDKCGKIAAHVDKQYKFIRHYLTPCGGPLKNFN